MRKKNNNSSHRKRKKMLESLGGGGDDWNARSAGIQNDKSKPLGGYQPNLIVEPHSASIIPWHMHPIKQEARDEERMDSGITSGGSEVQSSPGSENSQDINNQNFQALGANNHYPGIIPFQTTPMIPNLMGFFDSTPSKSPFYNNQIRRPTQNPESEIPPTSFPTNNNDDNSEESDHIKKLQIRFAKTRLSPKASENSMDGDNRSEGDFDEVEDRNIRKPKINSHGKIKKFKCRQCDFVAITKDNFWYHSRGHIKDEKLLTCPKCPFVTEYKHHLEYHLRNHSGSKPFKCSKCQYSCVNKSMLNSHMKSHSDVYQYRCADCSYATKYCHSLKLHLRKYGHKPAMVLNADGTPNPLPIIDVYGTRRGPKQKLMARQEEPQNLPPSPQSIQNSLTQFMLNSQLPLPFPYPFLANFAGPLANPLLFQQNLVQIAQRTLSGAAATIEEEPSDVPIDRSSNDTDVLDLSKQDTEISSVKNNVESDDEVDEDADDAENMEDGSDINSNQVGGVENKRDDKEEKMEDDDDDEEEVEAGKEEIVNNNIPNNYTCAYCSIGFGDVVLYTMHMGYHGYNDPFTCNMCGEQCNDKVSFFLHIARTSHS